MDFQLPAEYYCREFYGCSDQASLEEIGSLRYQVWEHEGTPKQELEQLGPNKMWIDKLDKQSYHWAIVEKSSGKIVAAARLLPCESYKSLPYDNWYTSLSVLPKGRIGHLGRDVVLNGHRSSGLGTYLNIQRELKAKQLGIENLIADIPQYRKNNFAKLGFQEIQPPKPGTLLSQINWSVVLKDLNVNVSAAR
jgi:predicted GNAT family N-acyltransferase